jgi:competence ComEA-like helix-hairpin-helix protein
MPDWVKQDALAAEAEAQIELEEAQAAAELPPEEPIVTEVFADEGQVEIPAFEVEEIEEELVEFLPEVEALEEPAGVEEPASTEAIFAEAAVEQPVEELIPEQEEAPEAGQPVADVELAGVEEEVPELPDWLSESAVSPSEELEWTPPAIPLRQLDLNQASLGELERIPGIGFITAQRISDYRDENGPFKAIDDLRKVPGIDAEIVEVMRDYLFVEITQEAEAPIAEAPILETLIPPETEQLSGELYAARQNLSQGNLTQAIDQYSELIRSNHELKQVALDLQEAAYRYPEEIGVWQSLGDAYLRLENVQEALEAYIKAEQLLG